MKEKRSKGVISMKITLLLLSMSVVTCSVLVIFNQYKCYVLKIAEREERFYNIFINY